MKFLHEFGHAYTAKYYGMPIASMGVALLVMFPVLYTDTSHVWRLNNRRARLHIAAAGMIVELSLAVFATLVWVVAPEGVVKSSAYFIAAVSWISSILVNLNPFMRFDGYYLLADLAGIDNLQNRSFDVAKWKLREVLFGLRRPSPEQHLSVKVQNRVILYAYGVWIYRLFLFIGIALLIYYMFFKVLGIILFVVEIIWFILKPIYNEMKEWGKLKEEINMNKNSRITLGFIAAFLYCLFTRGLLIFMCPQ